MSAIVGYDLDGVLAEGPPESAKRWGLMNGAERLARRKDLVRHYAKAPGMYRPSELEFSVITARKEDPDVRQATEAWLAKEFPGRVRSLRMLTASRSIENVVAFKAAAIRELDLTDFTEDNPKVVKALVKLQVCRIWLFKYDGKGLTTITLQELRRAPRR